MSRRRTVSRSTHSSYHSQAKSLQSRAVAPLLIGLTAQVAVGAAVAPALAAEWRVTPSVGVFQAVTDNVRQAPRGREETDTFTGVTPGVSVSATGARLNMNFDYSVTGRHYWGNDELDNIQHSLLGAGNMAIIPEKLFVDARASVSQQVLDPTGPMTASPTGNTTMSNSRSVRVYGISPYLINRFGTFADSTLRYSYDVTSADGGLGTTNTHSISETLTSGSDFSRLQWVATAHASKTTAEDVNPDTGITDNVFVAAVPAHDSKAYLITFAPEYAVNRYLHLLGGIGYEKIDDDTINEQPNGIIASGGVRVNPGPRSTFRVMLNHRYDDEYVTGDGSWLVGPNSRIDVAYTRDLQTTQSLYQDNLSYLGTDQFGNFVDSRSLQRFQLDQSSFGFTNSAFMQERYSLRYSAWLQRDNFSAELYQETRESRTVSATQKTNGVVVSWSRPLSYLMNFEFDMEYSQSEFDGTSVTTTGTREDQIFRGGPGLSYVFNETLTGTLNYDFLFRESNAAQGDLRENIISVGLRKIF